MMEKELRSKFIKEQSGFSDGLNQSLSMAVLGSNAGMSSLDSITGMSGSDSCIRTVAEGLQLYVQKSYVQKVLCSAGSMFRGSFIQKVLSSEGSMFRRFYIQKVLCSEDPMFRNICSEGPMFRKYAGN